MSDFEMFVVRY